MKKVLLTLSILFSSNVFADVACTGKIAEVYKWHHFETLSILLQGTNRWISMPTKSDESLALMAFATDKTVRIYWSDSNITTCTDAWENNKKLTGWFSVARQ